MSSRSRPPPELQGQREWAAEERKPRGHEGQEEPSVGGLESHTSPPSEMGPLGDGPLGDGSHKEMGPQGDGSPGRWSPRKMGCRCAHHKSIALGK